MTQSSPASSVESFAVAWGGVGSDYALALAKTNDDGYAIAGVTKSYGSGDADAFISKYDKSGNLSWNKTWGGAGHDEWALALVQTSDGGYAISGFTDSYGIGSDDTFLVKYDQSGNLSWNKTWGGIGSDKSLRLIQSSDGGYVIVGSTTSYGTGNDDAYLVKYDQSGNLSWSKTWGGANYDYATALIQTSDSGYAISGYTDSYGAGDSDAFLAKYDQSGNLSWSKTWGGTEYDDAYGLIQLSNGYATAGETDSYGAGGGDALLIKYKSDGTIDGCSAPMCQSPTASVSSPSASVSSPTASVSSPSATVTSPSATITSPMATHTVIVAPL